jgi:probable rRNA maturation factor
MPTKSTPKLRNNSRFVVQIAAAFRNVPSAAALRKWARAAASGATRVTLRVVGPAESRRLNRIYRKKNRPTNVLTFVYGHTPWTGDIVLCHPVIAREARAQGKALAAHYAHLVVHGMLHLRGHDHESRTQANRMERLEIGILERFGLRDPYTTLRQ